MWTCCVFGFWEGGESGRLGCVQSVNEISVCVLRLVLNSPVLVLSTILIDPAVAILNLLRGLL